MVVVEVVVVGAGVGVWWDSHCGLLSFHMGCVFMWM